MGWFDGFGAHTQPLQFCTTLILHITTYDMFWICLVVFSSCSARGGMQGAGRGSWQVFPVQASKKSCMVVKVKLVRLNFA